MCPREIIVRYKTAKVGLFIHSPFPSVEVYKSFVYREDILSSLLCCNVIGFHVFSNARPFLVLCRRLRGLGQQIAYLFPPTS
jgi:trehalose 6-phosphate synthase/phosphatase